MALTKEVLELLVCPKCKGELQHKEEVPALDCESCLLRYPVEGDIPVLIIDKALLLEGKK
ncbi:MAG: hypothetical protein C0609_12355 [Deltaproteobacteria bacterium]|nr:MAG: hypothetical protein C0609_12355 [Deltaproteobacteria bacterium]